MKAIVIHGPTAPAAVKLEGIERPVPPDDGLLVRVRASSANPVDLFPLTPAGYLSRSMKAQVLGTDFAGTVESVGKAVTRFQPGDEVFGAKRGAFAEYLCVGEQDSVARKPANVTFQQAGVVGVAAATALQALRDHGRVERGQAVLINGASGGVGTFAVQIARSFGAKVTAVCSTRNVELVRSLGADRVIDYTNEDIRRAATTYDLVIDIAGNRSWPEYRRLLERDGTYVGVGAAGIQHLKGGGWRALGHFLGTRLGAMRATQCVVPLFITKLKQSDLELLGDLLAAGDVVPVIDHAYGLGEVGAALAYLNEGHAKGKIVINVA